MAPRGTFLQSPLAEVNIRLRSLAFAVTLAALFLLLAASAYAFDEPKGNPELHQANGVTYDCISCHRPGPDGRLCILCHAPHHGPPGAPQVLPPPVGQGPHGVYTSTTDRCDACHSTHAAGGSKLLGASTVTDSCSICHDGTGGHGVFGALAAQGVEVGATHRIDTTSTVPGGDPSSGGSTTMSFKGTGGTLGCNDCHSPHDSNTVARYVSERSRTSFPIAFGSPTSKLLRQHPGGSTATSTVYGSDWCLGCHQGRASVAPLHNHPVDSDAVTSTPFSYGEVALLATDTPASETVTGSLAANNRGYLMPYPRTPEQAGHGPICQQCHEDSRYVGELDESGAAGTHAPFSVVSTDGQEPADNPRFQNFPHETANPRFLVEVQDDLCLNCHPAAALP